MSGAWRAACVVVLGTIATTGCGTPQQPKKIEWLAAPVTGEVATLVAAERARAGRGGRRLLVYVGASWCEPCRRFHDAVKAGVLDKALGDLRFLEFDLDRDAGRLSTAGYASKLIPLFALPGMDGRASGKQMEGSVKGDGAVAEIVPRLEALLRVEAAK